MNQYLLWVATLLLSASAAWGQSPSRVYTTPAVPSAEALDRLNLKLAWHVNLPMDGRKDGIALVQFVDDQIFLQLRSGALILLDANTGETRWRVRVGTSYKTITPVAVNAEHVYVVRGIEVYGYNRRNGELEIGRVLPKNPSTGPVADDERIYLCMGIDLVNVYTLPQKPKKPTKDDKPDAPPPEEEKVSQYDLVSPLYKGTNINEGIVATAFLDYLDRKLKRPKALTWSYTAETRIDTLPVLTTDNLILAGSDGTAIGLFKTTGQVMFRFQARSTLSTSLAHYGDMLYVSAADYNLYAAEANRGNVIWKFTGAAPLIQQPSVNDADLYVCPEGAGLHRLKRANGDFVWKNAKASRFLAANKKYVYAFDRSGKLLILDYARGDTLGTFDAREFPYPISNEQTDRLFLASNDGLLLCLHDRDYRQPQRMKNPPKPEKKDDIPEKIPGNGGAKKPQ